MANKDLKSYAENRGVKLWQVAHVLHLNDGNLSRKLRFELNDEEKTRFRAAVDEVVKNRSATE